MEKYGVSLRNFGDYVKIGWSFFRCLLIFYLLASASGNATQQLLDMSHSRIGFKVRHLRFWIHGQFKEAVGRADYDQSTGEIKSLTVSVDAATVDTNDQKRDEHLRSPDFLWTKKYSKITFSARSFEYTGKKKKRLKKIHGGLTIRGVTQPLSLDVTGLAKVVDPWGKEIIGFHAVGKLDRRDYGMNWNKALFKALKHLFVANEIVLELDIQSVL